MIRVFERAIEIAGDHLPTLEFVAAHYKDAIRGSDRDRLFKRILHAAVDGDDLVRALTGLALLNESRRELEAAKDYWQQLIAIQPNDEEAWLGLCRIHRVFGDHAALAAGLERLLDNVNDADKRLDLVRELAVLRAGPLQDPLSAVSLLRVVVSNADSGLGAWEVLRDIARDINDDDLLIEALSGMAAHSDLGADESYMLRLEQAVAMGLRLGETEKSIALLDTMLLERSSDTTALSYKALILERAGRWLDAATALENWAAVEEQSWSLSRALRRLAYITGVHLGDEERAQQLYEGVLEAEPDNREALDFLEKSYTSSKDWPALSGVLATLSDSVSRRSERVSLLHRLAELRFNELDDKQGAFHAYGKLLNDAPRDEGALETYVALADELGGWDQAQTVVEAVLPHLDLEKGRTLRHQLGQLRLDQDQDITAVVEYFRIAVADDPGDVASLEGLVGALERVGAWEEVAEAIEQLVGLAQADEIRCSRLLQLAYCLRDRVLSPKRAVVALDRVLKIDRENPDALRALAALGEAAGRTPEEQGLTLKLWSEHCTDPMERVDVLEALAKMAEYVLSESECVNVYNQILELDAANPTALQGLEHYFARLEDWENVAQVVSRQIDAAPAATRTRLELHLAEVHLDCLGDTTSAETVLTRLLERDTGDPIAIELLSRSYEMSGQIECLVDLLRGQADEALTEGRRADLLHRLGCVSAEHMDDEQEAVVFMERALAQNEKHLASLRFLGDFYLRDEQWVEARPVLETLVSVLEEPSTDTIRTTQSGLVADPAGLILLWNQLGTVLIELAEPEKAHLYFTKVVELQPDNMAAQKGIARLSWLSRDYDNAQAQYRTILDLHGKTLNEKEHATIRSHLGEIAAERGDVQHSRELLENALEMDSSNLNTVRELVSTCQKQEDWEAVV
ncbi:MAG TPA: tetratricopeptide repeat protein, partial [Myxococcales bacterium]|nr:tetratricopeptide repeat protein [Myxococcales bacterium]